MAGELLGAGGGLGHLLETGRSLGQMDLVISVMIIIGVIGTIMDNLVFLRLELKCRRNGELVKLVPKLNRNKGRIE